jgi:hypothetical protein
MAPDAAIKQPRQKNEAPIRLQSSSLDLFSHIDASNLMTTYEHRSEVRRALSAEAPDFVRSSPTPSVSFELRSDRVSMSPPSFRSTRNKVQGFSDVRTPHPRWFAVCRPAIVPATTTCSR